MSFEPKHDPWARPPRKPDNLDFFIWLGVMCVVVVMFGGPFLGAR